MIRPILTELALFAAPFALYMLFLWMTKTGKIFERDNWSLRRVTVLLIVGFLLLVGGFMVMAHWSGAPPRSIYVPAHVKDGKFVPGYVK